MKSHYEAKSCSSQCYSCSFTHQSNTRTGFINRSLGVRVGREALECLDTQYCACAVRLRQNLSNAAGISSNRSWSRAHVRVRVDRLPYTWFTASHSFHGRGGARREGAELPVGTESFSWHKEEQRAHSVCVTVGWFPPLHLTAGLFRRVFGNKPHFSGRNKVFTRVSSMFVVCEGHYTQLCKNRIFKNGNDTNDYLPSNYY